MPLSSGYAPARHDECRSVRTVLGISNRDDFEDLRISMLIALGTPPLSLAFVRQVVEFLKVKIRATAWVRRRTKPEEVRRRLDDSNEAGSPTMMRQSRCASSTACRRPALSAQRARMQPCVDQPPPAPCVNGRFVMAPNVTPATSSSALNARPMPSSSSRSKTAFGPASAKQADQSASPTIRHLSDNATDLSDTYTAAAGSA